jgi:formylglycine-generating enzyme required for sulfatase activity
MNQQVRIHEPLGERMALLPLTLGGAGAALVLPGADGEVVRIAQGERQWLAEPLGAGAARLNGMALDATQLLVDGDVLSVGEAQLIVHPAQGRIQVAHLAGNATVAPLRQGELAGEEFEAGVREVFAARAPHEDTPAAPARPRTLRNAAIAVAALLVLAIVGVLVALVPVPIQASPEGARIGSPALLHWRSADRIFLLPGRRQVEISHPGYRTRVLTLDVSRALVDALPLQVELEYLPGVLDIDTGGVAAELLVDGRVAGRAPGEVEVPAGVHDLILRAPGHVDYVVRLEVRGGGQRQSFAAALEPALGWLEIDSAPAGASVRIDGEERGTAPQRLQLPAGLHQLELSAGGRTWRSEVAVIAGQTVDLGRVELARVPPPRSVPVVADAGKTEDSRPSSDDAASTPPTAVAPAPPPPPPSRIESPLLGTLVLLPAGEYVQGSGRRDQGRRSNEVQRTVRLTRPFYIAATEVSNAQFRAFRPGHVSGVAMGQSLDLDDQAVSNVSWDDAVEFCNWLSLREGLPVAYERRDGRWQLVEPLNEGYRLPTEAEWEYAARYVDGQRWHLYAWGDDLPPPAGAANIAGEESIPARPVRDLPLRNHFAGYRDEHPVIAPVRSYARTPMGLYGMGGNVSEWVHDVYETLPAPGPVTDPMGPTGNGPHAIRGASWRTGSIGDLRAAWRERGGNKSPDLGFRVARYATGATP